MMPTTMSSRKTISGRLSRVGQRRNGIGSRLARSTLAMLALAAAGCGSSSTKLRASAEQPANADTGFRGTPNQTPGPVFPLQLHDSLGHTVNIHDYVGKVVLVTFIYTHCPDVCPLIVGNLHAAQAQLGAQSAKLQIIAVSTDPRGDTPASVKRFLAAHDITGRVEYLLGTPAQLSRTWETWGIVAKRSTRTPEFVEHSALIYGISASGKLLTVYPANFKPADVVHDVPLLARQ